MDQKKLQFITKGVFEKLDDLREDSPAGWGVMNAQEMTEHLADFIDISTGKIKTKLYTPEAHLPRYRDFLRSDKAFRENTKAPTELLGDTPLPLRFSSLDEARKNLQRAVTDFVIYFENDPARQTLHPAFGMLNYKDWVLLHYKHAVHHLKQFGFAAL